MTAYTLTIFDRDNRTPKDVSGLELEFTNAPPGLWLRRAPYLRSWYPIGRVIAITEKAEGANGVLSVPPEPPSHEIGLEGDTGAVASESVEGVA